MLLHKEGKRETLPSSYRPICHLCLLDELGKMLERVISNRIQQHLASAGPNLHGHQFGFRGGLSTVDAMRGVREFSRGEMDRGRAVLAVSLDITNTFNTLPWEHIRGALMQHDVSLYLQRILRSYLSGRSLRYGDRSGMQHTRSVRRRVPQGSVLGPLLWNLGFDRVLADVALPPHCATICYADDTLVLAAGSDWSRARSRADEALARVINAIRSLDLRVAPLKTEAVFLHNGKMGAPPDSHVMVDGARVQVGKHIKYLGLTIDERWSFVPHFIKLAPRLKTVANQCSGLMPNLGGPGGKAGACTPPW